MSTETIRLIRDGERGGREYGGGGRGRLYISITTVTTRRTSALRWAAMRAILLTVRDSHNTVFRPQLLKKKELKWIQTKFPLLTNL